MKENRISAKEYLDNNELLEVVNYIPYVNKVDIIDAIMREVCRNVNGTYTLDSVLLDRIKTQIFIEYYTNLDLSVLYEGMDGYDLLTSAYERELLIDKFRKEYEELERILGLRLNDYIRDKASVKGVLHYKLEHIIDTIDLRVPNIIEGINKIDVQSIMETIGVVLDGLAPSNEI